MDTSGAEGASMRGTAMRIVLYTLLALAVVLVGYLVLLALRPSAALPGRFSWFGRPASWQTIAIVSGILALLCILSYLSRRDRTSPTVPVVIVVGLTATSFVLGFSSYWSCNDKKHPTFFTTLAWTASLIKGGVDDRSLDGRRVSVATAGRARGRPPDDPGRDLRQRRRSCRCDIPHTV